MVPTIIRNGSAPSRGKAQGAIYFVWTTIPLLKDQTNVSYHGDGAQV